MKVIFHEKAYVDGRDGKEEISLVVLHLLNHFPVIFYKSEN